MRQPLRVVRLVAARPADSAAPRPTVPGGDGTGLNGRPAATLTTGLLNLARQIVPVIAADPSRRAPLVKLATDAQASIKADNTQAAAAGIKALRQALRSPAVPDGDTLAASHGPAPRSTPFAGSQARHGPEASQAQLDAGAMMQGVENARAAGPADSVQLAQLAMPVPLPLPLPPEAMPRILTPGMERRLGQAMNRAGRRMGHVGEEIARGDLGGAAGHAFLGRPFPPEVDDPALPGTGPHALHSESAKPATDEAPPETGAPGGGAAPGTAGGTQAMPPLPANPDDLLAQGWTETSHPAAAARGRRTFADPEAGRTIEFDKGRLGESGFRARDHYHVPNPAATGKRDAYLDKDGRPVPDGSTPSHIYPD